MVHNFYFSFPTKYIFGVNTLSQLASELEVNSVTKVCVITGIHSANKLGILEFIQKVCKNKNIIYYEYTVNDGKASLENIHLINKFLIENKIDFNIAVGGGTIIDIAKTIKAEYSNIPFGVILTYPASSSESNNSYVYYDNIKAKKIAKRNMNAYPCFAICDPSYMSTLTKKQMYSSFSDVFSHLLEQFFAMETTFIDDIIITCLQNIKKLFELYKNNLFAINEQAEYMLLTSIALSYIFSNGRTMDWLPHQIEHALTKYSSATHGENLSVIMPAWIAYSKNNTYYNRKLKYLGTRLNADSNKERAGLNFIQSFYHSIYSQQKLSSFLTDNFDFENYLITLFETPSLGRLHIIDKEQFKAFFKTLI